ncbi:hypothetical protein NLO413_0744 [Candidatus Neoehrlichia lotoris str. RAC413]|uniref:Uncharacterized protein n=2 Tax=Candidatus Neoehrlichia procyonis TaxID=467750 RepID=A0A0F3NMS2_9RICK|nr:hypothetical protein NLO413_0744 [Candidatus Neoehrlichia lotoris str. RAC413]
MKVTTNIIYKILACIFLITFFSVITKKTVTVFFKKSDITSYEDSNYVKNILIGCLNVVFSCIIYMLILIYCNIKLMLLLISITNEKKLNHFIFFESFQSKIMPLLLNTYITSLHSVIDKSRLTKSQKLHIMDNNVYAKLQESLKIIHSFYYHTELCK